MGISEASSEAMNVVSEQRKMLEEIKADAARLGQKDATKDDHFLQVADYGDHDVTSTKGPTESVDFFL